MRIHGCKVLHKKRKLQAIKRFKPLRPLYEITPARLSGAAFERKRNDIARPSCRQARDQPVEGLCEAVNTCPEIKIATPQVNDQHAGFAENARAVAVKLQSKQRLGLRFGVIAIHQYDV